MEFVDLNFLFRFLPLFLPVYFLCPRKRQGGILFAASLVFYAFSGWQNLLSLLCSLSVNYFLVRIMRAKGKKMKWRRGWLAAALLYNILKLGFYKYAAPSLPPGISFYTFTLLSYDIDVYLRKRRAARTFTELGVFAAMFPKLLSGPVMEYRDMAGQPRRRRNRIQAAEHGLSIIIMGLFFKVYIADTIGILWHDIQTIGFESISTPLAWMGVAGYSVQLLLDFQGYSLMAIGLAEMLGFTLPKNFDHPYRAGSISEYYRRWHISLGRWFCDYLYIPLGGNRKGVLRTAANLMAVWVVTGIWHGVTANFLLWGLVLGLLIVLEKFCIGDFLKKHKFLSHLYVWFLIPLTWLIFAVTDLGSLRIYFTRLFPLRSGGVSVNHTDWLAYGKTYLAFFLMAFAVSCPAADALWKKYWNTTIMKAVLLILFWLCIYRIANGLHNPFLYFSF